MTYTILLLFMSNMFKGAILHFTLMTEIFKFSKKMDRLFLMGRFDEASTSLYQVVFEILKN